jgi:hypothetical protein
MYPEIIWVKSNVGEKFENVHFRSGPISVRGVSRTQWLSGYIIISYIMYLFGRNSLPWVLHLLMEVTVQGIPQMYCLLFLVFLFDMTGDKAAIHTISGILHTYNFSFYHDDVKNAIQYNLLLVNFFKTIFLSRCFKNAILFTRSLWNCVSGIMLFCIISMNHFHYRVIKLKWGNLKLDLLYQTI